MNLLLEKTLPTILQELEVVYAVRPGQTKAGMAKFDAAVFLAQAILYVAGSSPSVEDFSSISIASDVSILINKMKDEGQLGGHGVDDPPVLKFDPVTGKQIVPDEDLPRGRNPDEPCRDAFGNIIPDKTPRERELLREESGYDYQLKKDNEAIRDIEAGEVGRPGDKPRYKLPDHLKLKNPENLGYEPPVAEV